MKKTTPLSLVTTVFSPKPSSTMVLGNIARLTYFCLPVEWYKANDVEELREITGNIHAENLFMRMLSDSLIVTNGTIGALLSAPGRAYTLETYARKHRYTPDEIRDMWEAMVECGLITVEPDGIVRISDVMRWYGEAIYKNNRTAMNTEKKRVERAEEAAQAAAEGKRTRKTKNGFKMVFPTAEEKEAYEDELRRVQEAEVDPASIVTF